MNEWNVQEEAKKHDRDTSFADIVSAVDANRKKRYSIKVYHDTTIVNALFPYC